MRGRVAIHAAVWSRPRPRPRPRGGGTCSSSMHTKQTNQPMRLARVVVLFCFPPSNATHHPANSTSDEGGAVGGHAQNKPDPASEGLPGRPAADPAHDAARLASPHPPPVSPHQRTKTSGGQNKAKQTTRQPGSRHSGRPGQQTSRHTARQNARCRSGEACCRRGVQTCHLAMQRRNGS